MPLIPPIPTQKIPTLWRWYAAAALILLADQLTKYLASTHLQYEHPLPLTPFLDLYLVHNRGAAFSFLSNADFWGRWFLLTISTVVSTLIALWWLPQQTRRFAQAGMTLILGGALGNLLDRAWLGHVIDFISLHYHYHYFPAFNLADSAITTGAALLALDWLILEPRTRRREQPEPPEQHPPAGQGTHPHPPQNNAKN